MSAVSPAVDPPASLSSPRHLVTAAAYLCPPALGAAGLAFAMVAGAGPLRAALGIGLALTGLAAGAVAGCAASAVERRTLARRYEDRLADLDHDLRAPMTIIRGEVELVLATDEAPAGERERSSASVIEQVEALEAMLRRRTDAGASHA
jgi:signal transduction histidine kinase